MSGFRRSRVARGAGLTAAAGAVTALLFATLPEAAHACAVCFSATEENREAFLATTAFLSLLPLGMVAGAGYWLRGKARQAESRSASESSGHSTGPGAESSGPDEDGRA